jgi:hypothetical protein
MKRRRFLQQTTMLAAAGASAPLASLTTPVRAALRERGDDMPADETFPIVANYYQQFDADYSRKVPGASYGGWRKGEIQLSAEHTAVVVMHAWDCGTFEQFPGVWRSVEYIPRSIEISRTVFPRLLAAVRRSRLPLFHVVGGGDYYKACPGYQRAVQLAGEALPSLLPVESDPTLQALQQFRSEKVWRGAHNNEDGAKLAQALDFLPEARPLDTEGVAEDTPQLLALCREAGVNHLIYIGFAIDACLLMSPGGMMDMSRHGVMCSAVRQAVTAVENRETARTEAAKELALWRVAVMFGFVFDVDDLVRALAM